FAHPLRAHSKGSFPLRPESIHRKLQLLLDFSLGERLKRLNYFAGSRINRHDWHDEVTISHADMVKDAFPQPRLNCAPVLKCIYLTYIQEKLMPTARVFRSGNSQAVRLPKQFRLKSKEVEIFRRGNEIVLRESSGDDMRQALELIMGLPEDVLLAAAEDDG